jgi:hypothetical protein
MKPFLNCVLLFALATAPVCAQTNTPKQAQVPPTEIVDELWTMATTGELLTAEGMKQATDWYFQAGAPPKDSSFSIVSNFWGRAWVVKANGNSADVMVGYLPAGSIDSSLRYTPPPPSIGMKAFMLYHLTFAPTHHTEQTWGWSRIVKQKNGYSAPDWKVTGTKTVEDPPAWHIEGAQRPFATVNTAIRYVLEMRDITKDPVIKQNADKTLRILLHVDDLYRKYPPSACACD